MENWGLMKLCGCTVLMALTGRICGFTCLTVCPQGYAILCMTIWAIRLFMNVMQITRPCKKWWIRPAAMLWRYGGKMQQYKTQLPLCVSNG